LSIFASFVTAVCARQGGEEAGQRIRRAEAPGSQRGEGQPAAHEAQPRAGRLLVAGDGAIRHPALLVGEAHCCWGWALNGTLRQVAVPAW